MFTTGKTQSGDVAVHHETFMGANRRFTLY